MRKNLIAFIFGLILCVVLLLALEGIFVLNRRFTFLPHRYSPLLVYPSDPELTEMLTRKMQDSGWAEKVQAGYDKIENGGVYPYKLDDSLKYGPPDFAIHEPQVSFLLKPGITYRSIVKLPESGAVVYDVQIEMDERGRRKIPENYKAKDQGILFFGDSFTFGEGVNNSETYPAQFANLNSDYQVYNFAIPGSSPSFYLQEIEQFPQFRYADLKMPAHNIGIFVLIDDSIERMICRLSCLNKSRHWMWHMPYYDLDSEGRPRFQGILSDRKFLNAIYSPLANSALVEYFGIDYPPRLRQSDLDFMATVLKSYSDQLKKYLPMDRFIVVSYPNSLVDPLKYKKAFAQVGIEFWDFSQVNLVEITGSRNAIPWDRHPSPLGHYLFAELLTYKFKKAP